MFRNVLVPVDLAHRHERVLEAALHLLEPGGRILLLHVIELIPGLSRDEEQSFYDRLERAARKHLAELGVRLEARSVTWRADVIFGARAVEVVRRAVDDDADLVVLASHALEPDQPVKGALSYQVGLLAPCPVLLVK